jgi:hypothetical protein
VQPWPTVTAIVGTLTHHTLSRAQDVLLGLSTVVPVSSCVPAFIRVCGPGQAVMVTTGPRTALDEMSKAGHFVRTASSYRNIVTAKPKGAEVVDGEFVAEPGRYDVSCVCCALPSHVSSAAPSPRNWRCMCGAGTTSSSATHARGPTAAWLSCI